MVLAPRLDLRQSQSLVMTPQLQQAIKLLQLSNLELSDFVTQELEQNPLLERDESDPEPPVSVEEAAEAPFAEGPAAALDGAQSFAGEDQNVWQAEGGSEGEGAVDFAGDPEAWKGSTAAAGGGGDLPGLDETLRQGITLREHLIQQINCDLVIPRDRLIALYLVDQIDDAGYLVTTLDDAAERFSCPVERIEQVLFRLQRLDPVGMFARSLAECLAVQLREQGRLDPFMQRLLDNLPLLAKRDLQGLTRACGVDAEDLAEMIAELKSLDPKPGLAFEGVTAQPVVPDILMRAQPEGEWLIELNSATLPRILVNTRYYARVSGGVVSKGERDYLSERLQSANWLVKSLHQRAGTILKVASEIVRQQDAFFRYGIAHLRPLILRDIAEAIGMHESTVSRVTTNKFMTTPRGLFELKYFFTSAIAAADGAEAHSAEAVKFRIKSLIDAEPPKAVLSDDGIVEILRKDGIDIARRTVAKYREAMKIPSSVARRREKAFGI